MFQTHQFDLSFVVPSGTQISSEIVFSINQKHLPEVTSRLEKMTKRFTEYATAYLGDQTDGFTMFQSDLFTNNFGYNECDYLTTQDNVVHLRIRLHSDLDKYNCSLTIFMLLRALGYPIEDIVQSNQHQVIEIMTTAAHEPLGYGHATGGTLSSSVIEWLRSYALDMSKLNRGDMAPLPPEVLLAMQTAWKAVTKKEQHQYAERSHLHGWVRDTGAFSMVCFGDACYLSVYPDEVSHGLGEVVQLSCHNLDLSEQQLTLLAGLAKICELAREKT